MNRAIKVSATSVLVSCVILLTYAVSPISTTYTVDSIPTIIDSKSLFIKNLNISSSTVIDKEDFQEGVSNSFPSSNQREQMVQLLKSQIGIGELADGTCKYVDWYVKDHSYLSRWSEWCAIFSVWCLNELGMYVKNSMAPPCIDSASCDAQAEGYRKLGRFTYSNSNYEPRPGDLIYFSWGRIKAGNTIGYDLNHVGYVVDYDGTYVYTIEGNTVQSGVSQVYNRKYPKDSVDVIGYAVPFYSGEEDFKFN